jgi:outer membrane protein TolC
MTLPSEEVAKASYDSVRYGQQLTRSTVVGNVAVTFFATLSAREELKVGELVVNLNRLLHDAARLKFDQQLIPEAEVRAAESSLASAEADLAVARTTYARSLSDFATALGLDLSPGGAPDLELVHKDDQPLAVEPLDDLLRQTSSRHPSVLAQETVVRQAMETRKLLMTQRYPTLEATSTIGTVDHFSLPLLPPVDSWSLTAFVRMTWKIFDFGALSLKLKQQDEVIQAETRALQQVKNQVTQSIVTAYHNLTNAQSRFASVEKAVKLTEELERVARQRFQQTLIPASDLLQAEVNLATARKSLIQAQYTARINYAMLQIAMGTE